MEGIIAIWQRDAIRFFRDKPRIIGSLAMPFMFLVLFGSGMSCAMRAMMGLPGVRAPWRDSILFNSSPIGSSDINSYSVKKRRLSVRMLL